MLCSIPTSWLNMQYFKLGQQDVFKMQLYCDASRLFTLWYQIPSSFPKCKCAWPAWKLFLAVNEILITSLAPVAVPFKSSIIFGSQHSLGNSL